MPKATSRRDFLQAAGAGLAAAAVGVLEPALALAAPKTGTRYGMVIDLKKCVACDGCTFACKQENHTPPGVYYNVVIREETGTYPGTKVRYTPRPCMHCGDPPCTDVCPVGATYKRAQDGIVVVDYETCIGCRYCMTACPYGARSFDFGENYYAEPNAFDQLPSYEYGHTKVRTAGESPIGNVRKCHFCAHRLERGEQPACVQTCMSKARIFGDLNDPNSEVARLVASRRHFRLKEELGTDPSVFYLSDD